MKQPFDKDKARKKYLKNYKNKPRISEVTVDMLKEIIRKYPDTPNGEIAESMNIRYSELSVILNRLRNSKMLPIKNRASFVGTLRSSMEQLVSESLNQK